jgi:hypothetical protein
VGPESKVIHLYKHSARAFLNFGVTDPKERLVVAQCGRTVRGDHAGPVPNPAVINCPECLAWMVQQELGRSSADNEG